MKPCFLPTDILLPAETVDISRWAVIACDQFTSQPEYWQRAEHLIGGAPSTLDIIYPEAWLAQGDARIERINRAMAADMETGVLTKRVTDGFVLVRRTTQSGERLGLVGMLDLEQYDYTLGTQVPVRATEGTILSRIPPRVHIRRNAPLESPHVMMLLDDPGMTLIEPLAEQSLRCLYDTTLMLGGGQLAGYAVEGALAKQVSEQIARMQEASGGFFLAVGDGNHSLATAKTCWEEIKPTLTSEQQENHPARFALAELVNLHSPALRFQPIHRVAFGVEAQELAGLFENALHAQDMALTAGDEVTFVSGDVRLSYAIAGRGDRLCVDVLQRFLDSLLTDRPALQLDYVHGAADAVGLTAQGGAAAMLLGAMDKHALFPAIAAGGVLPRKTFSMGESTEKRYYMECRRIKA